ncbi:MAG: porin family protein [Gammaproteobacteria bacterium]|nr:porin family protein [Gammaproteobacteria bacterium]
MQTLSRTLLTAAIALLGVATASAADKPTVEITPFIGYRMGGQFDVNNPTAGYDNSADLQDSSSWGVDIGIYRDATSFYEVLYGYQSTSLDTNDPSLKRADMKVEYYQVGGTLLYPMDSWAVPYLSLTVGATRLDAKGAGSGSDTKFSGTLGGGIRVPVGNNFAVSLGVRGYLTAISSDTQFLCASGGGNGSCLIKSSGSTLFQGEALVGFTAIF